MSSTVISSSSTNKRRYFLNCCPQKQVGATISDQRSRRIPDFANFILPAASRVQQDPENGINVGTVEVKCHPMKVAWRENDRKETREEQTLRLNAAFLNHVPQVFEQVAHSYRASESHIPMYAFLIMGTWFTCFEFGPFSNEANAKALEEEGKQIESLISSGPSAQSLMSCESKSEYLPGCCSAGHRHSSQIPHVGKRTTDQTWTLSSVIGVFQ